MNKIISALILGAALTTTAFASDKPAPAPTPVTVPAVDPVKAANIKALKAEIENIQLKQQLIQANFQNIQSQYKELSQELTSKQAELEALEPKPVPTTPVATPAEKK